MKTEDLITNLAGQLTPVRPLPPPLQRVLSWSATALVSIAGGVVVLGARPDVVTRLLQPDFTWTLIVAFVTGAVASVAALVVAVPGAETSQLLRRSAIVILTMWMIGLVVAVARDGSSLASDFHWPVCFLRVVAVGFVPAMALVVMVRRAAPLYPAWTALLLTVAAAAAGTLATQLVCPIDAAAHALIGHFAPVPVLGTIAAMTGRRLLMTP